MKHNQTQKNIPNGWSAVPAGDIFAFVKSYALSRDNLVNGTSNDVGIGNIHYGDIHSTYLTPSIDLRKVSVPMVKDPAFSPKPADYLKDGDLIMADASEDYEGVGVTVSLHGLNDKKVVGGLHTFVLRDTKGKTGKYFRQYIFRNPAIRNSLQKIANGVSVYGISKTAVSKLLLLIPPLPEQNRIVSILETWDKAIDGLKKKIEIKKLIKKGLMQLCLTGKIRVSGFTGEWNEFKLGDICNLYQPHTITSEDIRPHGNYKVYGANGVIGYFDRYNQEDREVLITCRGATCGKINYSEAKSWVTGNAMVAKPKNDKLNKDFLYYLLNYSNLNAVITGLAQPQITRKDLSPYKVLIPGPEEQMAIAGMLIIFDQELERLHRKLTLFQGQKNYLLNSLIIGTIRTPESLKTHS